MRSTALRFILEESSKSLDVVVAVPRGRSPERFSLGLYRGKKCDDFQQRKTSLRAEKKAFLSHVLKDAHTHNHTHTHALSDSPPLFHSQSFHFVMRIQTPSRGMPPSR